MVVVTTKVSKGKLVAILLILAVIVGLLVTLGSKADQEADAAAESALTASNNEERVAYLQSLGWEVTEEPVESQEVRIPAELPDVLVQYNELQKSQNFDLTRYTGKTVSRFVYEVLNYPNSAERFFATLLIYEDTIIGGDVTSASQDGLMQGLQFPTGH